MYRDTSALLKLYAPESDSEYKHGRKPGINVPCRGSLTRAAVYVYKWTRFILSESRLKAAAGDKIARPTLTR
jgi:hypothetical protein